MKREKLALLLAGVAVGAAAVGTIAICVAIRNSKKKKAAEAEEFELLEDA